MLVITLDGGNKVVSLKKNKEGHSGGFRREEGSK